MVSNVDVTKPTEGQAYTKDVRNNFSVIKTEIESLQDALAAIPPVDLSGYLPLSGGAMTGDLIVKKIVGVTQTLSIAEGGAVVIMGGTGGSSGNGGDVSINGANALAGSNKYGGSVSLRSGNSDGTAGGMLVQLFGGDNGLDATGQAGDVRLYAGNSRIAGTPGNVRFIPGRNDANNLYGVTVFERLPTVPQSTAGAVWDNNGVMNIGSGAALVTQEHLDELNDKISTLTKRIVLLESNLPPGAN